VRSREVLHNTPFQPISAHFRQAKNRQNTLKLFTISTNLRSRQAIVYAPKAFSAAGRGNEHLSFNGRLKDQPDLGFGMPLRSRQTVSTITNSQAALRFNAQLDESTALQPYVVTLSRTPRSRAKHHGREVEVMSFKSHPSSLCAAMVADASAHSVARKAPSLEECFIPVTLILFFRFSLPLSRHG
jgi:hypothetical protein